MWQPSDSSRQRRRSWSSSGRRLLFVFIARNLMTLPSCWAAPSNSGNNGQHNSYDEREGTRRSVSQSLVDNASGRNEHFRRRRNDGPPSYRGTENSASRDVYLNLQQQPVPPPPPVLDEAAAQQRLQESRKPVPGHSSHPQPTQRKIAPDGSAASNPINYSFPESVPPLEDDYKHLDSDFATLEDDDGVPLDIPSDPRRSDEERSDDRDNLYGSRVPFNYDRNRKQQRSYASPRQDALTRYSSTRAGKLKLVAASATVGGLLGSMIGKSIFNKIMPLPFAVLFFIMAALLRNDYGELSRSLGLALIFTLGRVQTVRRRYPTGIHIKSCLGAGQRKPFPPPLLQYTDEDDGGTSKLVENPWKFQSLDKDDGMYFTMIKSLLAMAFVGSVCGSSLPFIPTWMGSAAGALLFSYTATVKSARGDLVRSMGMRVVALVDEGLDINSELKIARKFGIVGGKILDKFLILDRRHRIKDRISQGFSWVYDKAAATAAQVQADVQQQQPDTPPEMTAENVDEKRKTRAL